MLSLKVFVSIHYDYISVTAFHNGADPGKMLHFVWRMDYFFYQYIMSVSVFGPAELGQHKHIFNISFLSW